MKDGLRNLLQRPDIWQGSRATASASPVLASGYAELDAHLHGGGWPSHAVTEMLLPRQGVGELQLLLPALVRLSQHARWLTWIAPPCLPYAPALQAGGVQLDRMLVIDPPSVNDGWWAAEQAVRSGACSVVMTWLPEANDKIQRRLQLAAETGKTWCVLFRPLAAAAQSSYAALRLHLEPTAHGVTIHILKQRGSRPVSPFLLRWH